MLTKFKHLLGIEGAKLSVYLAEGSDPSTGTFKGNVVLSSLRPVKVLAIHLKLEERYQRGRRSRKLIDKYLLAERVMEVSIEVIPGEEKQVEFDLTYNKIKSPIDRFADKGAPARWLAGAVKLAKNARSTYVLTAEAVVEGTRLNPFDRIEIGED